MIKLHALLMFLLVYFSLYAQNFWEQTNGPFGASITCLSSFNQTVYAGTPNGLFVSTNNGNSWTHNNLHGPNYSSITKIGINKNGDIFAIVSYDGLFRSKDNGTTWTKTTLNGVWGYLTVVNYLMINIEGYIYVGTSNQGIYRSTDNGDSWMNVTNGLDSPTTSCLSLASDANGNLYAGTSDGLFFSDNNGNSWNRRSDWPLTYNPNKIIVKQNGDIYASVSGNGLLRCKKDETTWVLLNTGSNSKWISDIALNANGDILFCTEKDYSNGESSGVFRSTDNGDTWSQKNIGLTDTDINGILILQNGNCFVGTNTGGMFCSLTNGDLWIQTNNGFVDYFIIKMAINSEGTILACDSQGLGIYRSSDNGDNWIQVNKGLTDYHISDIIIKNDQNIFISTLDGIFLSTDSGNTWEQKNNGFSSSISILSLAVSPNGDIFAGSYSDGVYHSTDNGQSWLLVNTGLPEYSMIYCLSVKTTEELFAGTTHGVYRSTDNGINWLQVNHGLSDTTINTLAIKSNGDIFTGTINGLFISTDDGDNWKPINNGLTDNYINSIVFNSNGDLFVGSAFRGAFISSNNGENWSSVELNTMLSRTLIWCLAINQQGKIFAGTGMGVFKSINSTTHVNATDYDFPKSFLLEQNYPNPFNPATTIKYSIPHLAFVTLKVFNMLGKEITTLVNEEKPVGNYEIEFNASKYASGIYFYRMQAGSFTETKKIILMK